METGSSQPSPALFFDTVNAYQRTAALKAAIDLELFTAIAEGSDSVNALSKRCSAHEHGVRILCDYLTIIGFLKKESERYSLTQDSALFLDKRRPSYVGSAVDFLLSPQLTDGFKDLAAAVRKGGTALPDDGTVGPDHPIWVKFARAMLPLMAMPAELMAKLVNGDSKETTRILDVAAGHGIFGIMFPRLNPNAEVVALDWANVLQVATENAKKFGVADRHSTLPGSAFDVDWGGGYDLVLLTNFLHHFDIPACETLLRKAHAALKSGGRAVMLEFVPNDDRVTPPGSATFSLVMLGTTPHGDAYTFAELERMAKNAGFARSENHPLLPTTQSAIISHKE